MAQITEPPIIPNLSLPVPQRTDPENFSERMDRTLLEIPLTVDGINLTVQWTYDTAQLVKGLSQAASQSVDDAAQQVELAKQEVLLAKDEVTNAAGFAQDSANSAAASEQARFDISQIIDTLTGELGLPDNGLVGAPIVKTAEGVAFDEYPLGLQARSNVESHIEVVGDTELKPYQVVGVDSSQRSFSLYLPFNPEIGDWVSFYPLGDRVLRRQAVMIKRGEALIMGLAEDMELNVFAARFKLEFRGVDKGWVITV